MAKLRAGVRGERGLSGKTSEPRRARTPTKTQACPAKSTPRSPKLPPADPILDSLPLDVWTTDADLRVTSQNAASRGNSGLLLGRPVDELGFAPDVLERWVGQHRAALRGLSSREEYTRLIGGEPRVYESLVGPLTDRGRITGTIGVAADMTDLRRVDEERGHHRQQLERLVAARTRELVRMNERLEERIADHQRSVEALHDSEERYRALVENASEVIFLIDASGRVLYVSPAIEALGGYQPDEIIGREFGRFIWPDDLAGLMASFARTLDGIREPYEFRVVTKSGETRYVRTSSSVMRREGRPAGLIGVMSDLTQSRKAREELERSVERLRLAMEGIIRAMAKTVEMRDPFTSGHQQQVADLALAIARELGLSADRQESIRVAGLIHDVGKIAVPAEILSKPNPLTEPELVLVQSHVTAGYDILRTIDFPWPIAEIVLQHHERVNGTGYPSGLKGSETLIEAKILAVADVIVAASSHRPYRQAGALVSILEEVERGSGSLFDANVVGACLTLFRDKGYRLERS